MTTEYRGYRLDITETDAGGRYLASASPVGEWGPDSRRSDLHHEAATRELAADGLLALVDAVEMVRSAVEVAEPGTGVYVATLAVEPHAEDPPSAGTLRIALECLDESDSEPWRVAWADVESVGLDRLPLRQP